MKAELKREVDTRQDDRWMRVFVLVVWTLYVAGVTAIAVAEDDAWPGLIVALAVLPLSAVVRSKAREASDG